MTAWGTGLQTASAQLSGAATPPAHSVKTALNPGGGPTVDPNNPDLPDPAAVVTSANGFNGEVSATGTANNGGGIAQSPWVPGTQNFGPITNALLDQGFLQNGVFAPSVREINGIWVMWFTFAASGDTNRIGVATGPTSQGPFVFQHYYYSPDTAVGLFDPNFWVNFDGSIWLTYDTEDAQFGDTADNNVYITQLSSDGTTFSGSSSFLASWNNTLVEGGTPYPGTNPEIENSALVNEPSPYTDADGNTVFYDLFLSYGTYTQPGSYHTVEVPCTAITSCDPNLATLEDNAMTGGGGA